MLTQALEQAGIRPSQQARRVGDYVLGELLADGPGYQTGWQNTRRWLSPLPCAVSQAQAASEKNVSASNGWRRTSFASAGPGAFRHSGGTRLQTARLRSSAISLRGAGGAGPLLTTRRPAHARPAAEPVAAACGCQRHATASVSSTGLSAPIF